MFEYFLVVNMLPAKRFLNSFEIYSSERKKISRDFFFQIQGIENYKIFLNGPIDFVEIWAWSKFQNDKSSSSTAWYIVVASTKISKIMTFPPPNLKLKIGLRFITRWPWKRKFLEQAKNIFKKNRKPFYEQLNGHDYYLRSVLIKIKSNLKNPIK